jgi:uncharacterized protein YjlB
MPMLEQAKKIVEKVTGIGRPACADLPRLFRVRRATPLSFADDGKTPNNPQYPLLLYRDVVLFKNRYDRAAIFEEVFAANGWWRSWRDGIYKFLHFHTGSHEVLGIARGSARVQLGSAKGKTLTVEAGDVVVLPAPVQATSASARARICWSSERIRLTINTTTPGHTMSIMPRRESASLRCLCPRPIRSMARTVRCGGSGQARAEMPSALPNRRLQSSGSPYLRCSAVCWAAANSRRLRSGLRFLP